MSKPFDATLKGILEYTPSDWPFLLGKGRPRVEVIDADISTISGATDKVLLVKSRLRWLLDVNFQSGPDASLPQRVCLYNVALGYKHNLPVRSLVILLAKKASLRAINGIYQESLPQESKPHLDFRYKVMRLWREPTEQFFSGGVGLVPLAPLSNVKRTELPGIITRMKEVFDQQARPARRRELWTATYTLMGLRYDPEVTNRLLQGVVEMEESSTYQAIIEKGTLKQARRTLLLLGGQQFGKPSDVVRLTVESIDDLDRLEQLSLRILEVNSWEELLEEPKRKGRKKS